MKGNLLQCSQNVWIVCGVTCGQEGVTEGARTVTRSEYTPEYHTIYGQNILQNTTQNILRNIRRYTVRIYSRIPHRIYSGISDSNCFPWNILRHIRQHSFPGGGEATQPSQPEYQMTQTLLDQFSLAPAFWKFIGRLESVLHVFVCHLLYSRLADTQHRQHMSRILNE